MKVLTILYGKEVRWRLKSTTKKKSKKILCETINEGFDIGSFSPEKQNKTSEKLLITLTTSCLP